ncbi:MAG: lipid-binding protein [Flavobacteriales bacterium]|nr:lipid-binding protein [Candidatus Arcticimaribacter sp.]
MKKTITSLFLLTAILFNHQNAEAQKKGINLTESSIHWLAKKVTGQHEGNINLSSGSLTMENGVLTGGSFVVDMNSISCTDLEGEYKGKLEGHLKSDDFFGVDKHPQASLTFTDIKTKGNGLYTVTGDFTIKGKTNPATFDFQINDQNATAKVIINRSLYDIRYGSKSFFDNLGNKMIYDDFELDVTLKL